MGSLLFVPDLIEKQLKKAVMLRNKVVHTGTVELKKGTVDSVIKSVRDLLYFLDVLSGESWAVRCISPAFLKSFAHQNPRLERVTVPVHAKLEREFSVSDSRSRDTDRNCVG